MLLSPFTSSFILLLPLVFSAFLHEKTKNIFFIVIVLYTLLLVFYTDMSGPDIDTYEYYAYQSCLTNARTDPLISFFFGFSCYFIDAEHSVKLLVFFLIFLQIFCIQKIFDNSSLALIVYFGFGNFFLSNFNVVSFNAALTLFLLAVTFRNLFLRYFILLISPLAHIYGLFLALSLISLRLKVLVALLLSFLFGLFFNLVLQYIGIEERLLNYFGKDTSMSSRVIVVFFSSLVLWLIYKRYDETFSDKSKNLLSWSLVISTFLLSLSYFVFINIGILERLINPILFIQIYFWLYLLVTKFSSEFFIKITTVVLLGINLIQSVNDSSNGWSLAPFNIIYF